jgi:hypothetical protein
MKKLVDDVSILAIEQCLMQELPSLFAPETIYDLSKEEVAQLAAESEKTSSDRQRCRSKLESLEDGLNDLKGLSKHRINIPGECHN